MQNKICIVYSHSKVGDLIWQLPYIKAISKYHSEKITLIVREQTQAKKILQNLNYFEKIEYNSFRKGIYYWIDTVKLINFFLKNKFSHVYVLDKVNRPVIASKFSKIKNIIGPGIGNQKKWLTSNNYLSDKDWKLSYSEQSQKLLKINNIPIDNIYPELDIDLNRSDIDHNVKELKGKIISFGIDASEDYKMWYEDYFIELAEKLYDKKIFDSIFLICSKKNESMSKMIIENSKKNYFIDCSNLDLVNVMAAIKKSIFFVGNNSGPLNLSSAMNIKSFGLIANNPKSELVYSKIIPIVPDNYKDNIWNKNRDGMKNLKVDNVFNFIINYLNNKNV